MYTQCAHCKAIFRINLREVTAAKGKLRCGECKQTFSALSSISTVLPEPFSADHAGNDNTAEEKSPVTPNMKSSNRKSKIPSRPSKVEMQSKTARNKTEIPPQKELEEESFVLQDDPAELLGNHMAKDSNTPKVMDAWDLVSEEKTQGKRKPKTSTQKADKTPVRQDLNKNHQTRKSPNKEPQEPTIKKGKKTNISKWMMIIAISLLLLLLAQVLYHFRHVFSKEAKHQPEKIEMLNHNVFVHPNEEGALLISALMKNTAEQSQPYPVLEVSLTDSQSTIVALRRFRPKEYIKEYQEQMLIPANKAVNFKLKIKDPGNNATRFQFNFL